jgi:phosphohistidine phosphatase
VTELYLVRHAIAANRDPLEWPDDSVRPLTADGEKRFRRAARGLRRLVPEVDLVLASPFARAWRTAEILTEEAGWPPPTRFRALEANRSAAQTLAGLRRRALPDRVAAVGHEPNLSEVATVLLAGEADGLQIELRKGGAICLQTDGEVAPRSAHLRWVLTPKALRMLAK